ncbi:hypothetical protein FPV67DRAFT_1424487 [Lyophyllum atratum]|nr:hypothetical protein FPV67DRAFT_1424699 [Lyophyllum atratum]KAF8059890.1 hypothetical protein FPV67DRAFT_1424487 [Lyophyllum atratum]
MGSILGSPLADFKDEGGIRLSGDSRLYRILMVESAYLILKLRCARVCEFENQAFSSQEVRNRWAKAMNERLKMDSLMTNRKYEHKALDKDLVLETWKGVLQNEEDLPVDWTGVVGVLVGRNPAPQLGVG